MKPSMMIDTLAKLIPAQQMVHIKGQPGVGKTELVGQAAAQINRRLVHIHCATKLQEDFGIPTMVPGSETFHFAVPQDLPLEGNNDLPDEGVVLLDEIAQAQSSEQKVYANMIQARELHGKRFKPGWTFISTGNRDTDRAGASKLLTHLGNRMIILDLEPDLDDFTRYAIGRKARMEVVSFLRFKPGLLVDFDAKRETNASPRAWLQRVSPILDLGLSPGAEHEAIQGSVGEGPAAEFVGYLEIFRKAPNPDTILMAPDKAEVPTEAAVRYAVAGAIAYRATPTNIDRVVTYARRLPPEYGVLIMRDALSRDPTIASSAAAIDWISKDGKDILM